MTAGETVPFGPGVLEIGAVGSEIDVSCLVNSMRITAAKTQGETTTKLCGTQRTPAATYTYSLAGNIDLDLTDPDGLWALSQVAPGTEVPFTYTPNTDADTTATGVLILDPLDFGGEEYGEIMNSDLEWVLKAKPTYTMAGVPIDAAAAAAASLAA